MTTKINVNGEASDGCYAGERHNVINAVLRVLKTVSKSRHIRAMEGVIAGESECQV